MSIHLVVPELQNNRNKRSWFTVYTMEVIEVKCMEVSHSTNLGASWSVFAKSNTIFDSLNANWSYECVLACVDKLPICFEWVCVQLDAVCLGPLWMVLGYPQMHRPTNGTGFYNRSNVILVYQTYYYMYGVLASDSPAPTWISLLVQ